MLFLGTGASELIPNPLCGCDVCRRALASRDPRDKRCRSAFLLDGENMIDCGPDVMSACAKEGVSLQGLKRIFLTHSHSDHFASVTLENLQMCVTEPPKLEIYLSREAWEGYQRLGEVLIQQNYTNYPSEAARWPKQCTFIPVEPFTKFRAGDMTVAAVVGRHPGMFDGEQSLNYLFQKEGKSLFYACDTGLFYPETFDYLKGFRLDTLVIECVFGKLPLQRDKQHMNLEFLFETIDQLTAQGTVNADTHIYITHVGHKGGLLHEELNEALQARYGSRICAAYDGLRI